MTRLTFCFHHYRPTPTLATTDFGMNDVKKHRFDLAGFRMGSLRRTSMIGIPARKKTGKVFNTFPQEATEAISAKLDCYVDTTVALKSNIRFHYSIQRYVLFPQ
jgi:hypothetical protein